LLPALDFHRPKNRIKIIYSFLSKVYMMWSSNNKQLLMRLSMISRIIQTEVWIILDIMRKPNPIIVLLYI
jgi:hypothetical protein